MIQFSFVYLVLYFLYFKKQMALSEPMRKTPNLLGIFKCKHRIVNAVMLAITFQFWFVQCSALCRSVELQKQPSISFFAFNIGPL